jgi:hypothetical protein
VSSVPTPPTRRRAFRLPRLAYLAVLFVLFGVAPLAFAGGGDEGSPAVLGPRATLLLIPVIVAAYIARTATIVSTDGIEVRALLGRRRLSWQQVRGLSISGSRIYAVVAEGAVRLPCVRIADLHALADLSDGRLPDMAKPVPKFAPSRRPRPSRRR